MKVAVIQLAYGDDESVADRTARVVDLVRAQRGQDLVVLPELWPAGGFDYRALGCPGRARRRADCPSPASAAKDAGVTLHGGSIVERGEPASTDGHGVWNTSLVFFTCRGARRDVPEDPPVRVRRGEPRLMDPGDELVVIDVPVMDGDSGVAPTVPVGLSTCYDLRFPELYRALVDRGAQVLVIPAAWPAKRVAHWTLLGQARAIENQSVVIQCNTAGTHAGHEMGGRSQVVDATGTVLAAAGPHEEVLSVEVDTDAVQRWRQAFPALADRRLR